ncbi:MAG: hypothetical protein Q8Q89_01320 [bacterium]|nr:hypothetical protein [bacterium]
MELSIFLAKVLGLYLIIVSVAVWLRRKDLGGLAVSFAQDKVHIYLSGVIFLLLGLALVVSHNIWDTAWQGVISVLGWMTLVKAGMRIFFTNKVGTIAQKTVGSRWYWLAIIASFPIGIWLTYTGFSY